MLSNIKNFRKEIKLYNLGFYDALKCWRQFFKWIYTLDRTKTSIDYQTPWFNYSAIEYIDSFLKPNYQIFEYGGGGSTLYFLKNGCNVYTVEHDLEWYNNLKNKIHSFIFKNNWHGYHILPEIGLINNQPEAHNPNHFFSTEKQYETFNFKQYATKIREFENDFFDIILIDGRARPSCLNEALAKVKSGGLIVLDNSEREYYIKYLAKELKHSFDICVNDYGPVPFTNWFHKTTIWKKK